MKRVALYCGTTNVYPYMAACAKSLLKHTKMDKIYFFTETDEFPEQLPDVIECINIKDNPYLNHNSPNYGCEWTWMTFGRLLAHNILPEDRVLYMDCDAIVDRDIGELFDVDLKCKVMAAVREPDRCKKPFVYYNAGILLMNLAKMREGIGDEMIRMVNTVKLGCPDQDTINLLCQGRILELMPTFNSSDWTEHPMHPHIVHYAGVKRYWEFRLFQQYLKMRWSDLNARDE